MCNFQFSINVLLAGQDDLLGEALWAESLLPGEPPGEVPDLLVTPLTDNAVTGGEGWPSPRISPALHQPKSDNPEKDHWLSSVHGAKIFNLLPVNLINENSGDFALFKNHLKIFLTRIPDQPTTAGLARAAESNSLLDQVPLVPDLGWYWPIF